MPLFQKSVLNKYLNNQKKEDVDNAYNRFTQYFHNPEIQQNIKDAKEEQFQEGFLRELFVNILGYTLNPNANFNLTTEYKNETGAKKADGAVLQNGKALAVIELKGTNTKDLDKINKQAFDYKNNHTDCIYVITSNFEKLRFFIHNAVEYIEFNLFTLTKDEFEILWLSLQVNNLLGGIPQKAKNQSILVEENITKQLYKDYSTFKTELWQNIVKNIPDQDKLLLFKKTQKLLDRFLFIFFAEDSGLLPPNSISRMVKRFELLEEEDAYKPLYEIFKQYFDYINIGRKGKTRQDDIFAYNGGLFLPDEVLDADYYNKGLKSLVDDNVLKPHVLKLTSYDFQSEVDVNILGHIFENSLSEIENITARLEGKEVEKSKTKRKKDGVFYTPKYITKYIVDNTIGKLCQDKKTKLGILDEEYAKGRKNRKRNTVKKLAATLNEYRKWLLNITICDPACGSGAFLNQALEFLINEHSYIDELHAQLLGISIVFKDVSNHILEQNIYGVDINEESVDIAKLSLWLRTAQRGRKLTSLSNNIKCGNSLIDDPKVAGEKAFIWQNEFPGIFHEKNKTAFHITTATHDSRTSQRMVDYKVREKRNDGLRPIAKPIWLKTKDELLITKVIAEIVKEDKLNVLAYNICGDHIHLLLVCESDEVQIIMQKIKGRTSREYHKKVHTDINKGLSIDDDKGLSIDDDKGLSIDDNKGLKSLVKTSEIEEENIGHLWTQKFGCKEIGSEEELQNVAGYIQTNRDKHKLPPIIDNKGVNSLVTEIEEMCCDYEVAFRPEYNGGFDVVIGNPPYVRAELISEYRDFFSQHYKVFNSASDLFAYFYELGSTLINQLGVMGFISNTFDKTKAGEVLRHHLTSKNTLIKYIDFTEAQVFEGTTTYPVIIILNKEKPKSKSLFKYIKVSRLKHTTSIDIEFHDITIVEQNALETDSWTFLSQEKIRVFNKLKSLPSIREKYGKCYYGIKTALNEAFIVKNNWSVSENVKYIYEGKDINKWYASRPKKKIILFKNNWTKVTYGTEILEVEASEIIQNVFPELMTHLLRFEEKAKKRYDKGEFWWELRSCAYYSLFDEQKIIFPNLQNSNKFCLDSKGVFINAPAVFLPTANKTILCILNSKIVWEFLKSICVVRSGGYIEVKPQYFEQIPIPELTNKEAFDRMADYIINSTKEFHRTISTLSNLLQSKFDIVKLSKKLQNWHELEFGEFLKELEKARKVAAKSATRDFSPLPLPEQAEWMQYFNEEKSKAQGLKKQIDQTDSEIDQMVYKLYDLTDEEIRIVEQG